MTTRSEAIRWATSLEVWLRTEHMRSSLARASIIAGRIGGSPADTLGIVDDIRGVHLQGLADATLHLRSIGGLS